MKSAEKKRRLRELMEPGAAPYIRAESQEEKELEQTKYIGRKWRQVGWWCVGLRAAICGGVCLVLSVQGSEAVEL